MRKFRVVITPIAEDDVEESFTYIYARSPLNAVRWLRELYESIDLLADAHGFGRAPESDWLECDLREKVFKSHRIIFSVDKSRRLIYVHYVRHGARRGVGEPESDE